MLDNTIIRPMGAFERAVYWHNKNNPAHFVLVAEVNEDIDVEVLRGALAATQARHPLLSAAVEVRSGLGPVFVRPEKVGEIPLRVVEDGRTWAELADSELVERVETTSAPQARAALLRSTGTAPAAILLTFDHAIADGRSAVVIMRDLFAALNGARLPLLPVPESLETRLAGRGLVASEIPAALDPADDRMFVSAKKDPFGSAPYEITSLTLDADLTGKLVARARAEETTVHAALLSAMSTVLWRSGNFPFPRVYYPIDVRDQLGADTDSGLYLIGARTAFGEDQVGDLWQMARHVTPAIRRARSSGNLAATSAMIQQVVGVDFDAAMADAVLSGPSGFEATCSNLGTVDLAVSDTAAVRPTAVFGPVMGSEAGSALNLSVATFQGRMRLVNVTSRPIAGYLTSIRDVLAAAT
ncbi:NRPS condensation-like uncharacterized protein [Actinoplanes lutulentus]|uniref:Condensation domain-containing protein n=1 Tax=Actinoplanes lutulentus TaxID=1287878 RepID=A0A327Z360_9ACTN|nr:hypothetical protein [Actinoplanes lutulentus]MBB2946480.1 NRPS condensation-like uncharacterized protein [Actinoplanes lutulentus]RAK24762.1 condensation domain-containing protein [Actinoplanes lutulentus]